MSTLPPMPPPSGPPYSELQKQLRDEQRRRERAESMASELLDVILAALATNNRYVNADLKGRGNAIVLTLQGGSQRVLREYKQ